MENKTSKEMIQYILDSDEYFSSTAKKSNIYYVDESDFNKLYSKIYSSQNMRYDTIIIDSTIFKMVKDLRKHKIERLIDND